MYRRAMLSIVLACSPLLALDFDDGDMEKPDRGPWNLYGTPVTVEKNSFARSGQRSLHVVTDNKDTMGGNFEGTSHALGRFEAGDLLKVSFWYWPKGSGDMIVGIGPGSFEGHWSLTGTDWTRADLSLRCHKSAPYSIWISQADRAAEFFLDDFTVEVVKRPQLGKADEAQRVALTGGPLRLTLCKQTGALCGIENLETGETYAPVGARQPLFGLEILSADGMGFERVPFDKARLVSFESPGPKSAKMQFDAQGLPIRVTVEVQMLDDGAARFAGEVKNDSPRKVTGCEMPMLFGLCPASDPARLTLVTPHVCGQIIPDPIPFGGCETTYPGRGVMGWMDLSGDRGGVYLAGMDQAAAGTRLAALPAPGPSLDLSLAKEIVVRPGETWGYPGAILAVHPGDWHASADRYRRWARGWMRPPDVPQWLRDANGWVLTGVQNGIPFRRLPDIYRQAQWMGIEYLHVQGEGIDNMWFDAQGKRQGHTMTYVYPSPKFGGVEGLKAAVRKIHENEGHVMFYFLYERWTPSHSTSDDLGTGRRADVPQEFLPPGIEFYNRNALVEAPGRKPPTEHPFMAIRMMCLASPGWQEWMRFWAADVYARQFGADGFYWDVMGRNGPFRCFNKAHGHEGENEWARGSASVLEAAIRQGRDVNPDYSCAIEGCSDHLGQWVGFHLMSGATKTPNVFRYTFPEYLCVDGFSNHYWTWSQVEKARRVFLDGERFDIHGYHQGVKPILNLRRRIKPFTDWPAVFRDTVGLKVSDPRVQARAFVRTDGDNRAIAVTMMNEERVENATVAVNLAPIGKPKATHLFHLDGHVSPVDMLGETTQTIPVPKDDVSAAVIVADLSPELRVVPWIEQIMRPGSDGAALTLYMPLGPVKGLSWRTDWPAGYKLEGFQLPDESFGLAHIIFQDDGHLRALKRWAKVKAHVTWEGGKATAWCVLAPPLVNGDFEEAEDGGLTYWGTAPETVNPGQGRCCARVDRETAPNGHITELTPVKPNCKYRFRCMIRRVGEKPAAAHLVEYQDAVKGKSDFVRSATLSSSKVGEWETLETTFTTQPNPRTSAIYLYNHDPSAPAFFDGMELEEVR